MENVMRGSAKQVAWATKLRDEFAAQFEGPKNTQEYRDVIGQTDARFWIESRKLNATQMLLMARGLNCGDNFYAALRTAMLFTPGNISGVRL